MVEFDNNRKVYQAIAMEDLKENSIALNVFPVEALPGMVGGGFKAASTTASFSTIDEDGNTLHHSITTSNHITAEWSSFNGESKPNNVKKGQQVVLYQIGNTDKWYWSFKARDAEMGTTDNRVEYVPARPMEKSGTLPNDEDAYKRGINTIEGIVTHLKTSQANGEPVAIHIVTYTKQGLFSLTDNKGVKTKQGDGKGPELDDVTTDPKGNKQYSNSIIVDFVNNTIQLLTNEGAMVMLNKKDISLYAPRDIIFCAERQMVFQSPVITFNKKNVGAIVFNCANIGFNVAQSFVVNASVCGFNAVSKITKALVTAGIRCSQIVTGATGSAYTAVTSNLNNGKATTPNNSADTDTAGASDRTMAAWPQVEAGFQAVANQLQSLANQAANCPSTNGSPCSVDVSQIIEMANQSECEVIKGA